MSEPTNADIFGVLLGIKEDIGGLKASTDVHLKALTNHGERITTLEGAAQRQKGAMTVWGIVATAAATFAGAAIELFRPHH